MYGVIVFGYAFNLSNGNVDGEGTKAGTAHTPRSKFDGLYDSRRPAVSKGELGTLESPITQKRMTSHHCDVL